MMNNVAGSSCVIPMLLCDDDQTARGEQRVGSWLTKLLLPIPVPHLCSDHVRPRELLFWERFSGNFQ